MIEDHRGCLIHLNKDFVFEAESKIEFEELSEDGAGIAKFSTALPTIIIKSKKKAPLVWALRVLKCADGAFVTFRQGQIDLHIVELKSGLDARTWETVLSQYEGMYLSAIAALRLLQITKVDNVICYLAYKRFRSPVQEETNPVLLKGLVGVKGSASYLEAMIGKAVALPFDVTARLVKGQRDPAGDIDFGAIA